MCAAGRLRPERAVIAQDHVTAAEQTTPSARAPCLRGRWWCRAPCPHHEESCAAAVDGITIRQWEPMAQEPLASGICGSRQRPRYGILGYRQPGSQNLRTKPLRRTEPVFIPIRSAPSQSQGYVDNSSSWQGDGYSASWPCLRLA